MKLLLAAAIAASISTAAHAAHIRCGDLNVIGSQSIVTTPGVRTVQVDGLYYAQQMISEVNPVSGRVQFSLAHQNGQLFTFVEARNGDEAAALWDAVRTKFRPASNLPFVTPAIVEGEYARLMGRGGERVYLRLLRNAGSSEEAYGGFCRLSVK